MKNIIFTFLLIFIGYPNSYSQDSLDTDKLNNLNNVFLFSLKEYCTSLDSLKTKTVYVDGEQIGDIWPKKINGFEVKYLGYNDYKKTIRKNGGKITLVKMGSLEYRNGQFYVGVIPFLATYSRKTMHMANGGGLTVYFDYIPKKGFIYKDKKWSGI